jgi:hypothetical protein
MWIRRRRPRGARRRAETTRRTKKGPRPPVRRCRWRKRRLLYWRHRPKRYRLPARLLRQPLPRRGRARFGPSVSLISKPIFRRSCARRSRRRSLAQGSHPRDRWQSSPDSVATALQWLAKRSSAGFERPVKVSRTRRHAPICRRRVGALRFPEWLSELSIAPSHDRGKNMPKGGINAIFALNWLALRRAIFQ